MVSREERSQSNNLTVPRWLYSDTVWKGLKDIFDKWLFFPLTCVHCGWQCWYYNVTIIISSPEFLRRVGVGFKCLSSKIFLSWVKKNALKSCCTFFIILTWFVYCIIIFANINLCLFLVKTQSLTKDYISSQKCEL